MEGVSVILRQELHLSPTELQKASSYASRRGWTAIMAPAISTSDGKGTSGGVGIFARRDIGMVRAPAATHLERGCVLEEGRSVVAAIPAFVRGGVVVVSTYLRHSEGWTEANLQSVQRVAEFLGGSKQSWIWGGDFNMGPQLFNREQWLHH